MEGRKEGEERVKRHVKVDREAKDGKKIYSGPAINDAPDLRQMWFAYIESK